MNSVCLCDKLPCNLFRKYFTLSKMFLFLFMNPLSGLLISLGDTAAFTLVCLSLCFQPRIRMPGSAGYHGASSLLSAHFNSADFSSWYFISVFPSVCLVPSISPSLCPPILIPFLRKDKPLLNNVVEGPQILFQFVATRSA